MTVVAGRKALAAQYPKLYQAFVTSDYTVTTSEADVGCSVDVTNTVAGAVARVQAVFEVRGITTGFGYVRCRLMVAGATQTREVLFAAASGETRATCCLNLDLTLATATTHTIKMRALKTVGAGDAAIVGGGTGASQIGITLYDC